MANENQVARIRFGVDGGASIRSNTSGGDILADLNRIAAEISKPANRPKIMFAVGNTADDIREQFQQLVGNQPINVALGIGVKPTAQTTKQVEKYSQAVLKKYQKVITDVSTSMNKAFSDRKAGATLEQLGLSADDAAKEVKTLTKALEEYAKLTKMPALNSSMSDQSAVTQLEKWVDDNWDEGKIAMYSTKHKRAMAIDIAQWFNNMWSVKGNSTASEAIGFFDTIRKQADIITERLGVLQGALQGTAQEVMTPEAAIEDLPDKLRAKLDSLNGLLSSEGFAVISPEQLLKINPDEAASYLASTLGTVMQEVKTKVASGAEGDSSGAHLLRFAADTSAEAQAALAASIDSLVGLVNVTPRAIRFVADTSETGLTEFQSSLETLRNLTSGAPVEVKITAGTSQEFIDKLAESIQKIADQLNEREFVLRFTPAAESLEALRASIAAALQEAFAIKTSLDSKIVDGASESLGGEQKILGELNNVLTKHIDLMRAAEKAEYDKSVAAIELTDSIRAEAAAFERCVNALREYKDASKTVQRSASKKKTATNPGNTAIDQEIAAQEAQMWKDYEQQKLDDLRAATYQREQLRKEEAARITQLEKEGLAEYEAENQRIIAAEEARYKRLDAIHKASVKERDKTAKASVKAVQQQQKAEERSSLTYDKLTNKLTTYYHSFEREISKSPQLMSQYQQLLNNLSTQSFGKNMTEASAAVQRFEIECEKAGITSNTFIKRLVSGFGNKLFYGGLARAAMYVRQLVKQVYDSVKEIDSAMTQLKIVTGATDAQMKTFLTTATNLATKLGKSVSDILGSVETFSRLGYSLSEAGTLTEFATILSNVANVDVSTATTGLTSIMKSFGLEVEEAGHVSDVLVNVGQKYAISAEELMAAFERGGSALAATGTSFDKAAAIFAAANASMQNAEKVGTAIQTVSARIRGAKSELEELGADYEDVAEGVSKYRDELMALTNVNGKSGFDIMADVNTGDYKDIYDIFVGIAKIWDQLSETSQARVAEILGGTRQLSVISSVLKNIGDAQNALDTAMNSAGVAMRANDTYMKSIEGRAGKLKADFQAMSTSFLNSNVVKFGVDLVDAVVKIVGGLSDANMILPGILATLVAINEIRSMQTAAESVNAFVENLQSAGRLTGDLAVRFNSFSAAQQRLAVNTAAQTGMRLADAEAIAAQSASVRELTRAQIEEALASNTLQLSKEQQLILANALFASRSRLNVLTQEELVTQLAEADAAHTLAGRYEELAAAIMQTNAAKSASVETPKAGALGLGAAGISVMGWVGIAVTALTFIIPLIKKLHKSSREIIEDWKTEKAELDQLNQEYETKRQRIAELEKLAGSETFTEANQKELDELKQVNEQLDLQLQYKRLIAEDDRKKAKAAGEKEMSKHKYHVLAYQWTDEYGYQHDFDSQYGGRIDLSVNTEQALIVGAQSLRKIQELRQQAQDTFEASDKTVDDYNLLEATLQLLDYDFVQITDSVNGAIDELLEMRDNYNEDDEDWKYLQGLIDVFESLAIAGHPAASAITKTADSVTKLGNAVTESKSSLEKLDNVRDHLKALGDAFKEATGEDSEGVSYSALSGLAEKFKDVEGIDTFIDRLAAAGNNAEEVQSILRELTYQYIIASNDAEMLSNASDDVIAALLREAGVANADKNAIIELKLAMIEANKTNMTFDQQIASLERLAQEAGVAIGMLAMAGQMSLSEDPLDVTYSALNGEGYVFRRTGRNQVSGGQLLNQQQYYTQLVQRLRDNLRSSFNFGGGDSTKTGGGGSKVEDYIADIDKYRDAIRRLNQAQAERANIEYKIGRSTNLKEQIALQRQLIATYGQERDAITVLNGLRKQTITEGAQQLRELGFAVTYNAEADDFWVQNLDHLNELQGANQDATNELRKDTEELINTLTELNDNNNESAESYRDLGDNIEDAHVKIKDLLQDIVKEASEAVDSMQSVYDALHKAADEYQETGFVTIDTVQSIIELGAQYMQYLLDENGQLVINEERIRKVIAAKMDQLAIENALSYIEALRIAQTNGDIDELNRLLYATEDATDATWGFVYATLALLGLNDDQYQAALHNINAIRSLADASVQSIGNEFDKMKQGMDDILKYVMEMIKQQISDRVDALNDEKKAYSDIIDQQKESLNLAKKQNDYQKTIRDKLKEMAKLRAQIDALSLDSSREAQAKRIKLEEELAEIQKELADTQNDHAIEAHEEALDKMNEAYAKEKDGEIKILEDSISSYQKLYDMAIDYINTHWDTLYQELIDWNYQYGTVLSSEITSAWDQCLAAAQRYGSYIAALGQIDADRLANVVGVTGNYNTSSNRDEQAHAIVKEMYANSLTWWSDKDKQAQVKSRNQYLGSLLPALGINASYSNGDWFVGNELLFEKYKKYIYHSGGIAGNNGTPKQDEVMALLKKGEPVLSRAHERGLYRMVDFTQSLASRVKTIMQNPSISYMLRTGSSSRFAYAAAGGGNSVTFGDVYIHGADRDTLEKHREINRQFVDDVIQVLGLKK